MEKWNSKKKYSKPDLEKLGDLRSLTLGPSPGAGDSGAPLTRLAVTATPTPNFPIPVDLPGGINQPGGNGGQPPLP
jgi:hypothetical protein